MTQCTLCKKVKIVPGTFADYKQLAGYHYRDTSAGQFTSIYVLVRAVREPPVQGVIVYSRPTPGQELRNIATNNFFAGFDQGTQLSLLNKTVRRISRVIIEPRFRGLGLASWLVAETMHLQNVPVIEAVSVMGWVHPFFEKAGMNAFHAPAKERNVRLTEALSAVGIENLLDPADVHRKIERLPAPEAAFIDSEIRHFLRGYTNRRYSMPSLERTTFVLKRLTQRPVYYIWFNPELPLKEMYNKTATRKDNE